LYKQKIILFGPYVYSNTQKPVLYPYTPPSEARELPFTKNHGVDEINAKLGDGLEIIAGSR
jgi:hypothetical protein